MSGENLLLVTALGYAKRRAAVFPCKVGGKEPITLHGFKDATTDEATIRSWWGETPNANVAIATGEVSKIVVLDIDCKGEVDGEASLRALLHEKGWVLPETRDVRTPNGGRHLYFRLPEGVTVRSSAGKLGPGLDVRGDGGYVIAPPSVVNGKAYEWVNNTQILPPVPDWMAEKRKGKAKKKEHEDDADGGPIERIRDALDHVSADDRKTWLNVIWAVARATGRSPEGLALVQKWSRKSAKHDDRRDPEHIEREYHEASAEGPDSPITIATVFKLAREGGWVDKRRDADHYRLAQFVVETLVAESGNEPVFTMGEMWTTGAGNLWVPFSLDSLAVRVGEMFGGGKRCSRVADFKQVAWLVSQIALDERFFERAAIGIAAPGGFYRVDESSGEIKREPLTPEHRQRMRLAADPDPKAKPERLIALLEEAFAGHEPEAQIALLQQLIGCAVTRSLWRYRVVALLLGATSSGKSVTLSVLQRLFPRDQIGATPPSRWAHEYHVAMLAGKVLNIVGELDAKDPIPAGAFKQVTGRDLIDGRHPTHRPFSFVCEASQFFNANRPPPTSDKSDAFYRRWRIVHFANSVRPEQEIRDLDKQIIEHEMGAFLWWALCGAAEVVRAGGIMETETHREAVRKWRVENNSALSFLLDREVCELGDTPKHRTRGTDLFKEYKEWAGDNGFRALGRNGFYEAIDDGGAAVGVRREALHSQAYIRGVRLLGPGT
jgi:putative DNA primase/helicase